MASLYLVKTAYAVSITICHGMGWYVVLVYGDAYWVLWHPVLANLQHGTGRHPPAPRQRVAAPHTLDDGDNQHPPAAGQSFDALQDPAPVWHCASAPDSAPVISNMNSRPPSHLLPLLLSGLWRFARSPEARYFGTCLPGRARSRPDGPPISNPARLPPSRSGPCDGQIRNVPKAGLAPTLAAAPSL